MMFEKHDGWYGFLDLPSCKIHSRAMREIPSLVELSDRIRAKRPNVRGRLIFEIMIHGLEIDSFPELNGILNRKYEQVDDVYLCVHDYLPDFKFDKPASLRYEFAREIVTSLDMPEAVLSHCYGFSNKPIEWQRETDKIWSRGGEGLILKKLDGIYMPEKRNFSLMKIKEELTLDLLVVGTFPGKSAGKYADTLGGLIVKDKFGIEHRVSGMSDEERDTWWADKDIIVGKVVEVKAMKRLKDGSLREPRFKAIRFDKLVTDID